MEVRKAGWSMKLKRYADHNADNLSVPMQTFSRSRVGQSSREHVTRSETTTRFSLITIKRRYHMSPVELSEQTD